MKSQGTTTKIGLETCEVIARKAATQISDWEAKTYGKPNYSHPSQEREIEHITPIILAAIEQGIQSFFCNSLNDALHLNKVDATTATLSPKQS